MGNKGSVTNRTPYKWKFHAGRGKVHTLQRNGTGEYLDSAFHKFELWLKYEDHLESDLMFWADNESFTIRESSDRQYFELVNNSSRRVVDRCPNFGRIEEQKREREKRRRERHTQEEQHWREEERRRQAELERNRRIQEQIKREKLQRRQQEERRWREEEEKRRQAELERNRRIQQQIKREKLQRRQQEERRWREEEEKRRQAELERNRRIQQQIEREKLQRRQQEERRRREQEEKRRQAELQQIAWMEIQEQEKRQQEVQRLREEQEKSRQEMLQLERWQQQLQCQQEEEEKRLHEELEQQNRIQQQIEKENEDAKRKIYEAQEKFQEEQKLKERVAHQHHTQVLHQMVEANVTHIDRNEVGDVDEKFEELLLKYQITENGTLKGNLEDRMKSLQNELALSYFREHPNPSWSLWALDQATGYVDLSLTDRFNVLEAVVKVTVEGEPDLEDVSRTEADKKTEFLLGLQDQLYVANPTLARTVLINVLGITSQLSQGVKEILSQILFNNIWTPKEITFFIGRILSMDQEKVPQILYKVYIYRLSCLVAVSALENIDPIEFIQDCISDETDKDIDTILSEMQNKNYPDHILSQIKDILQYVDKELPKHRKDINAKMIEDVKRQIVSLDSAKPDSETLKEVLIVLSKAVKKCTTFINASGEEVQGYFPRLTQFASLLLLLLSQLQDKRGCLLEIGTGEGKTCILAMFALIQAMRGIAVDIVTSSPLLAIRDQEEWSKLYDMFGVTSSTVPPQHKDKNSFQDQEKVLEDAYMKQIVYSTVSTFAADILIQEFEKKTTRGWRKFECVIVDEVDYMTLDSGVQVTFLSHQASSLRHVEHVLASIWAMVSACRPIEMFKTGKIQWATRNQNLYMTVKHAVFSSESEFSENDLLQLGAKLGFYSQVDIDKLDEAMSQKVSEYDSYKGKAMENIMAKTGPAEQYELLREVEKAFGVVIDCFSLVNNKAKLYGKKSSQRDPDVSMLLLQNGRACEVMSEGSLIERVVENLRSRIKYSKECVLVKEPEDFIVIPSFLKEYIEKELAVFVANALKAITMTPGREYMIDQAPEADIASFSGAKSHHYDAIIPVDFQASGVLEKNKRWGDGLQQFLEMKHQLRISQLSSVTNYMSNICFFKRYLRGKGIFGVSGTLGGQAEKAFLERQYKTACYVIPAHRQQKLVELPAVQVSGGNPEWIKLICEAAWTAANRGQVVLIICEDVKTANELRTKMCGQQRQLNQITMYTISEKHNIEKQMFSQGNIIIATNLAGRGTDIHVQQEVNESGGIFVLLTYLPLSQRMERQVFGRTARKGNPGMVQMILNQHHLEPAYQGHSVETMRQLREEYEVHRLEGMQKNELVEIQKKEDLFLHFCEFLDYFDKSYSQEERNDFTQMRLIDVPQFFKPHREKFDYQPALNALKESWAFWLIFHEEHISKHDDIIMLREDLTKNLKKTAKDLLQGRSNNFYDYVKLAKSRTDMHHINKKDDYGALFYWQRAIECDPSYSAAALYNQAYITINLRKKDYITEAKRLLKKTKTAVDVYLSETANTMMLCNLSVTKDFATHNKDSNLQTQMKARMAVFKSWKGYIENALESLQKLESSQSQAKTEDSSVYSLSRNKDPITTKELMVLHELGLSVVFEVKEKPEFCVDALLCFFLGVLQIAAGALVYYLSCSYCPFVSVLIKEGVHDIIDGVKGMVQGSFDWAKWAISKAIRIGVSLVFEGLGILKDVFSAVDGGITPLITGAKCYSVNTIKQCFKHAMQHTVQELGGKGCVAALNYVVDKRLTALFQKVLKTAFEDKVFSLIRANDSLDKVLTDFICSGIPKSAIEWGFDDFKIDRSIEKEMHQSVDMMTRAIIPHLMMDCTKVDKVLDKLLKVCSVVSQHLEEQKELQLVMNCLESVQYFTYFVQVLSSVPTKDVINNTFIPQLLQVIKKNLPQEKLDRDERRQLSDVKRLKDELINKIAKSVSDAFVEACSRHMTSIVSKTCISNISDAASSAVCNILNSSGTQSFFDNQLHQHETNQAIQCPLNSQSKTETEDLDYSYIEEMCDVNYLATALDIHVLTESDALQGKGIRLFMVDKHGKKLSEDHYPGKDSSADDIVLQLRKDPETPQQNERFLSKLSKRIHDEQTHYGGHFEFLRSDGCVVPVNSEGQNSLYYAVAQATSRNEADLKQKAVILQNQVKYSIQQNQPRYAAAIKLQRGYEEASKSPRKYTITGGGKKTQDEIRDQYQQMLNIIMIDDSKLYSLIKTYNLGLVAKPEDVTGIQKEYRSASNINTSPVSADYIPPQDVLKKAHEMLDYPQNRDQKEKLRKEHPGLFSLVDETGNRGLCREVLAEHHQRALTTGYSPESCKIRGKLTEVLLSGDVVKLLKMSMIAANPEVSESLRADAKISRHYNRPDNMPLQQTRRYQNIGANLLVQGYSASGVLNSHQKEQLLEWLKENTLYFKYTPEYYELLGAMLSSHVTNRKRLGNKTEVFSWLR